VRVCVCMSVRELVYQNVIIPIMQCK